MKEIFLQNKYEIVENHYSYKDTIVEKSPYFPQILLSNLCHVLICESLVNVLAPLLLRVLLRVLVTLELLKMACIATTNLTITLLFTLDVTCVAAPTNKLFSIAFEVQ